MCFNKKNERKKRLPPHRVRAAKKIDKKYADNK